METWALSYSLDVGLIPFGLLEEGWISGGHACNITKVSYGIYLTSAWESALRIEDEFARLFVFLATLCPPFVPPIKPIRIQFSYLPDKYSVFGRNPDLPEHRLKGERLHLIR
jgi:hypothetical protein